MYLSQVLVCLYPDCGSHARSLASLARSHCVLQSPAPATDSSTSAPRPKSAKPSSGSFRGGAPPPSSYHGRLLKRDDSSDDFVPPTTGFPKLTRASSSGGLAEAPDAAGSGSSVAEGEDVFLDEAMSLLSSICASPAAARQLTTPEWLALLLRMADGAPLAVQRRTLRILRGLVPTVRPASLRVFLPRGSGAAPADALGFIGYLLDMIDGAVLPSNVSEAGPILDPAHVTAQQSSEAVALTRALLHVRDVVYRKYLGFEAVTTACMNSAVTTRRREPDRAISLE